MFIYNNNAVYIERSSALRISQSACFLLVTRKIREWEKGQKITIRQLITIFLAGRGTVIEIVDKKQLKEEILKNGRMFIAKCVLYSVIVKR